jgi:hypothetical protein
MIGGVNKEVVGTYLAINDEHVPRYLAGFCYWFNRRFELEALHPRLGYWAGGTPPMPLRFLEMAEVH